MPSEKTKDVALKFLTFVDAECQKRGWTRNDLAREGGFSPSVFTKMSTGQANVGVSVAKAIARVFGISQIEVYLQAGIIDDMEEYRDEANTRHIDRILSGLPDDKRSEIIELAEFFAQRERSRQIKNDVLQQLRGGTKRPPPSGS